MKGLLASTVALLGLALGLSAYNYSYNDGPPQGGPLANSDAAMTPDSGSSGVGYGTE